MKLKIDIDSEELDAILLKVLKKDFHMLEPFSTMRDSFLDVISFYSTPEQWAKFNRKRNSK